jgi:hypothetical protein
MEIQVNYRRLQDTSACPYPEPNESVHILASRFPKIRDNIVLISKRGPLWSK